MRQMNESRSHNKVRCERAKNHLLNWLSLFDLLKCNFFSFFSLCFFFFFLWCSTVDTPAVFTHIYWPFEKSNLWSVCVLCTWCILCARLEALLLWWDDFSKKKKKNSVFYRVNSGGKILSEGRGKGEGGGDHGISERRSRVCARDVYRLV